MTENIYPYLVKLPDGINEMITPCIDGYTVYIDERLTADRRDRAYSHAVKHIRRRDFEKRNVGKIEKEAHE